jgi:hypothetical protein
MATCTFENCTANAMADGSGCCYWHNPNISEDERQRARARGGVASRPVKAWAIPEEIQPVETILDLKRLYNSALSWLVAGLITPSQATSLRALCSGLHDCLQLELYQDFLTQRKELIAQAEALGITVEAESEELCLPR